jgi:hypothetical protein
VSQDDAPGESSGVPGAEPAMRREEPPAESPAAALDVPPAVQVVNSTGYLTQMCVTAASSWVQRLGPGALAVWRDFVSSCAGGPLAPLITPEQYAEWTTAVLQVVAMERGAASAVATNPLEMESDDDVPF